MNWSYSYTSDIWPALITFATAVYLGSYSWSRRDIPAAKPLVIACLLAGFWSLGVILEISAVNFSAKVFWIKYQAIWQLPLGTTITCFVFEYAGLGHWLNRRNYIFLFLVPTLSIFFILTNDFHHLIWTGFRMERYVISLSGRLYWVFNGYIYLLGVINFVVLVRLAIFSPGYRLTVAVIVSGQIIARVGYTLYKLQLIGPGESILLTIGVMETAYAFALLRFHAIDPVAAARRAVLQQMRDGWLVLDLKGRILDMNPIATAMLGMPFIKVRQKSLIEVIPVRPDFLEILEKDEAGGVDITLGKENSKRQYNLNLSPLRGRREELIGRLLLFHDITKQKQTQDQIIEQQKTVAMMQEREYLARELHDGIGQILGYLSIQAQTALKWLKDGNIGKAEPIIGRIVEVARDAHVDIRESILSLRAGSGRSRSFIPALKKYTESFQANYGIRTELFLADGIGEDTFSPSAEAQLLRVIQEAMTNARKHSGSHNLKIHMDLNNSKARITITDDGNGFDAENLEQKTGSHFGLVFMRERIAQIGGSFKIDSMPGSGTVLKLEVPIHEQGKEIQ